MAKSSRLFLMVFVIAAIPAWGQQVISLDDQTFNLKVEPGPQMFSFEDQTGAMKIDEVLASSRFEKDFVTENLTGVFWFKMELYNASDSELTLVVGHQRMSFFIWHQYFGDSLVAVHNSGFYTKRSLIQGENTSTDVFVELKPKSRYVNYIKIQNTRDYGIRGNLRIWDSATYYRQKMMGSMWDAAFIGACLILVLYTLTQWLVHKSPLYFWLLIHTLGVGLYALSLRNYFVEWFFPESPSVGHLFGALFTQVGHLGMLVLIVKYFKIKTAFRPWGIRFRVLVGLLFARSIAAFILMFFYQKYVVMTDLVQFSMLIDAGFILTFFISIRRSIDVSQRTFIVGIVLYLIAYLAVFAAFQLFEAYLIIASLSAALASLFQVIFFAIALGLEMRQHEVDKNKALDDLNEVLSQQNKTIQKEVDAQTRELREKNERIETLFREIHHRVKNNLQLISSLLNTQREWSSTEDPAKAIEDSRSRVVAMSMIHQFLYRKDDIATIDFGEYAEELVSKLDHIQTQRVPYRLSLDFDKEYIFDIDTSISLGLILNELVTNSYKHAVEEGRELRLKLTMVEWKPDQYELTYLDNGAEMATSFEEATKKGFGLRLASRLSKQLQGVFSYEYRDGNEFKVRFAGEKARLELID